MTDVAAHLSLEMVLDRRLLRPETRQRIAVALATGRLVVLREALQPVFAKRVHAELIASDAWRPYEGAAGDFHFRHHNLYDAAAYPPALAECRLFFDAVDTRTMMSELSGRDCSAPVAFSASWYMPGDYSLPHNDCTAGDPAWRQVAFLWHLTKDWDGRWGGHLYWGPTQLLVKPGFNTLCLFIVRPEAQHFVAPVAPNAAGQRLAVTGWWKGPTPYPPVTTSPEEGAEVLRP